MAAALVACVCACGSPQIQRDIAKQGWQQLTSAHFELVTDLPPKMARLRLIELERLWHALADNYILVAPALPPPARNLRIVHFDHCRDFGRVIWRDGIAGYVSSTIDFEQSRMMVTCERRTGRRRGRNPRTQILLHELAHVFNNHYFARTPVWLNEGLATYYQTLAVENGRVIIGRLSFLDEDTWRHPKWLPTIRELLAFDHDAFYAKGRRHYYASWKLIHLLNSNARYQRLFRAYLARLAKDDDPGLAWRTTVGTLPVGQLQRAYKRYEQRDAMRLWTRPYRPRADFSVRTIRRMQAGEVHALWAHLQMIRADATGNRDDLKPVAAHLRFAAADDPDWPEVAFWRACLAFYFGREDHGGARAERLLHSYVRRRPDDARGRLAIVEVGLRRLLPKHHLGTEATPPPGLDKLQTDVAQLARLAHTAAELDAVARYYALRRQPRVGLSFARRALRADSRCSQCMDTLALLLYQRGDATGAVTAMQRAIHMLAERKTPAAWRKRLAIYRRARSAPR